METLFEIAKFILPSLIVFMASFYTIKQFMANEERKRYLEGKTKNAETITPIRLQAYERIVIFLERISPNSLVMRTNKVGVSARFFHGELLKAIRSEFEHNISQQIYMNNQTWESVKNAKEETIKLINLCASNVSENASAMDLSQMIIEAASKLKKLPTQTAVEIIKKEIAQSF